MSLHLLSSTTQVLSDVLDTLLTRFHLDKWHAIDAAIAGVAVWTLLRLLRISRQKRLRTTELRGPPSDSLLYGVGQRIAAADNPGTIYESWMKKYGSVYTVPATLGNKRVILCDPKAIAHFHSEDSWTYGQTKLVKEFHAISVRDCPRRPFCTCG